MNCDPAKLPRPLPTPRPTFPTRETEHTLAGALSLAFLRTDWHRDRTRTLPVSSWRQAGHSLRLLCNRSEIQFGSTAFLIPQRFFGLDRNAAISPHRTFTEAAVRVFIFYFNKAYWRIFLTLLSITESSWTEIKLFALKELCVDFFSVYTPVITFPNIPHVLQSWILSHFVFWSRNK